MRFGIGARQARASSIFLTLGTGVGSGVFNDGIARARTPSSARWRSAAAPRNDDPPSAARTRRGPLVEGLGDRPRRAPRAHRARSCGRTSSSSAAASARTPTSSSRDSTGARRSSPAQLRNDAGIIGAAIVAGRRGWPTAAATPIDDLPADGPPPRRTPDPDRPRTLTSTAAHPEPPTSARMVIGGETVDAADGQTFDVVNPATGRTIATAPLGGHEDVDRAVAAARAAFDDRKGWANWAAGKRGRSLAKLADLIKKQQRGAGLAREPQRRQADHRARAARSSARASSSTTTPAPRTRSSARRSRSRSRAST